MKTSIRLRKWFIVTSTAAIGLLTSGTLSAQTQTNKVRIGVYDSRAVAIAYANSTEGRESMKTAQADYQKAKAEKNEKKMKQIESGMKLQQRRLHEQGFSTGSVVGTMAKVKDVL